MKPILFNTEMVKAILAGRKTVTRRKIDTDISYKFDCEADGTPIAFIEQSTGDHYKPTDPCGYQPGDILYVRETFADTWTPSDDTGYVYKANGQPNSFPYWGNASTCKHEVWRPSLHMPKKAARLFLRVTGVRVERLQDITCVDAEMEGVSSTVYWTPNEMDNRPFEEKWWDDYHFWTHYPQVAFSRLWDSTVSKSDINKYGWDANPWVWVISFERISKEDAI